MYTSEEILCDEHDVRFTHDYAARICREHGTHIGEFYADHDTQRLVTDIDAATLLRWLGY